MDKGGYMTGTISREESAGTTLVVGPATSDTIDAVKRLADAHRHELGFIVRASLVDACQRGALFVAYSAYNSNIGLVEAISPPNIVGFVQSHFRRDGQTTLHAIAVEKAHQHNGVGTALIRALLDASADRHMRGVLLRCPTDLGANAFYQALDFRLERTEAGKRRQLNVWFHDIDYDAARIMLSSSKVVPGYIS